MILVCARLLINTTKSYYFSRSNKKLKNHIDIHHAGFDFSINKISIKINRTTTTNRSRRVIELIDDFTLPPY